MTIDFSRQKKRNENCQNGKRDGVTNSDLVGAVDKAAVDEEDDEGAQGGDDDHDEGVLEVEDELDVPDEEEDARDEVGESDGDGPGLERAAAPGRLREEVLLLHDSSSLSSLT